MSVEWDVATGRNIRWTARLGSECNGTPVIAGGRIFVGTNNTAGWLERFPPEVDLGVLACFDSTSGRFLWQYSSPKLPTGKLHDWPEMGICSTPLVRGRRLWFVSNRCELVCLDVEGFHDGENNGPFRSEASESRDEADVVWTLDMRDRLGVAPHNTSNCSVTLYIAAGGTLFAIASESDEIR